MGAILTRTTTYIFRSISFIFGCLRQHTNRGQGEARLSSSEKNLGFYLVGDWGQAEARLLSLEKNIGFHLVGERGQAKTRLLSFEKNLGFHMVGDQVLIPSPKIAFYLINH